MDSECCATGFATGDLTRYCGGSDDDGRNPHFPARQALKSPSFRDRQEQFVGAIGAVTEDEWRIPLTTAPFMPVQGIVRTGAGVPAAGAQYGPSLGPHTPWRGFCSRLEPLSRGFEADRLHECIEIGDDAIKLRKSDCGQAVAQLALI